MNDSMPPGLSQQGVWQVQSQTHPPRRPCVHTPPTRNTSFNTFPSAPYALTRHTTHRFTLLPSAPYAHTRHTTHRSTHIHLATPLSRHAPATHPQSSPLVNSPL